MPFHFRDAIQVVHIPLEDLPVRIQEIPRDKQVALFCPAGARGAMAYVLLRAYGYTNAQIFDGGYVALVEGFKPGRIRQIMK